MLYGRGAEQAAIDELLRAAGSERRSGVLVLRGEPGIGKTALLDHAAEAAASAPVTGTTGGWTVLRAAGVESESDLPFAALQLLLAPALGGLAALPEPQRQALERAFGLADPDAAAALGNRLLVGLGVLGLLAELAESGPVLCLVDDLQWCDAASTEALLLAARRLRAEGVVVLIAAREGEGAAPTAGLPELRLSGLDEAAAAQVLARHAPEADEMTRRQLLELAHGNPLALRELPGAEGGAGTPLPLAGRLQLAYHGQLSRLPAATQTLLLVAAAEESGELSVVLDAAERLGASARDLQPAEAAALVGVTGPAGRLAFRHPLLRSAVLGRAPLAQRLAAHAALAEVLDGRETPGGDAAVRRAWHLVQAAPGPDESVAATLEGVAETAAARGGPSGAAAAYERAALLSPLPEDVTRRLVLAAEAAAEAGEVIRAESLAGRAHARKPADPVMLAHVMFIRGVAQFWRGAPEGAHRLMLETADLVADAHPVPTARVLLHALDVARTLDEAAVAETLRRLAELKLPPEQGLTPVVAYLLASTEPAAQAAQAGLAGETGHTGQAEPTLPAGQTAHAGEAAQAGQAGQEDAAALSAAIASPSLERAARGGRLGQAGEAAQAGRAAHEDVEALPDALDLPVPTGDPVPLPEVLVAARAGGAVVPVDLGHACSAALSTGRDDEALAVTAEVVAEARACGVLAALPPLLVTLAEAELFHGRAGQARAHAEEALALAEDVQQVQWSAPVHSVLAYLAAQRGDEDACHGALRTAEAEAQGGAPALSGAPWRLWSAGLLDLGHGRAEEAFAALDKLLRTPDLGPVSALRAVPDALEAAVRLRRGEELAEPLARFERWAQRSDRAWARALVLRCHALLAPEELAEQFYREAMALHAGAGRPWEEARTALLHGEWLRRARRKSEARAPLRAAARTFDLLDAAPWAARARAELDASGAAPSEPRAAGPLAGLTPQENQIVRLAAQGLSNRDIAAQLFLSARTVGYHLYKAYPKLGVASRGELAALV